jgi:hypothetical protein
MRAGRVGDIVFDFSRSHRERLLGGSERDARRWRGVAIWPLIIAATLSFIGVILLMAFILSEVG